ncbi:AraC family transcriptional regulator [Planotetraspora thailandica]|uniref:AraC family transcriptional regulator n=1 Tax=Planotetraspora thailandica TaxID=487172 RepID=A0A8J3V5X2_9ACTN|nr:AraC family transcriptional regulator [Planotetraspora thailandica]GII57962.1 AraC family transcriptional regulator [Planotetraspora thailandica]
MLPWSVRTAPDLLDEIRGLITAHVRPDLQTPIDGLLLSKVETAPSDHSLTEPLLVVMAQGGKRLLLGDQVYEYQAGQILLVTATLPVTGHYIDTSAQTPSLGMGLVLRPAAIAPLMLEVPAGRWSRTTAGPPAIATGDAGPDLLDAAARMLRLLDHPEDAPILAPMIERELLWRLLTGPHGGVIRQIGLADSGLSHVNGAIRWIRDNYAEPMRISDLARLAGMSPSAFHRHFRAITAMSPLQFQKRIRLQEARSLLAARPGDVAGVGHLVGYDSPSQFNREYRRLFGAPPGQDSARLRADTVPHDIRHLP